LHLKIALRTFPCSYGALLDRVSPPGNLSVQYANVNLRPPFSRLEAWRQRPRPERDGGAE